MADLDPWRLARLDFLKTIRAEIDREIIAIEATR